MNPERRAFLLEHLINGIGLSDSNATAILDIFDREAARVVRSTPFSSSGMFPSFKNRAAIHRESRTGELPYDRILERDDDVLAYAHQPDFPVKASWAAKDGRKRTATMTGDRLVIRRGRVVIVEVKTEEALVAVANERPGFLVREPETGRWRCPSAEAYLAQFGIEYEIVTPTLYPQTQVRNFENLGAAFRAKLPEPAVVMAVVDRVRGDPGLSLADVATAGVTLGEVLVLVAAGTVYVDLERDDLTLPRAVPVYPNRAVAEALASRHTPSFAIGTAPRPVLSLRMGAKLTWIGARVEVVAAGPEHVLLREAEGDDPGLISVARSALQTGWAAGELVAEVAVDALTGPHAGAVIARERYEATGQAGIDEAVRRDELLKTWKTAHIVPCAASLRSLRRWEADRREMEAVTGDPFVGLCPLPRSGNREPKIDARVVAFIDAVIKDIYLVPNGTSPANVIAEVTRRCRKAKLPEPHDRTVQRRIDAIPAEEVVAAREGRKASYNLHPWAPINPDASRPNGDFPFSVGHVDGSLFDLEVAHSESGMPLGRPWIHRLVDGPTGIELARYIAFVEPCEAVVLELLWRCAVRWGVLPLRLVADLGAEHRGGALHTCCLANGIEIDWRPKSRPRHGSPVERGFLTLDLDLLYQLAGNTQSRKNVRQETKEINPTNHAIHSLAWLDGVVDEYNEIIGQRVAQHLGGPRAEALRTGLAARAGSVIPYVAADVRLRFLTMAPVENTTRYIHPVKGFTVGRQTYFNDAFQVPPLAESHRPVRAALGDPTWVLVDVGGGYLRADCRSLARERVTSMDQISQVAVQSSRTGTLAAKVNKEVKVEVAGLTAQARETADRQRERLAEVDPEAYHLPGGTDATWRARLQAEENRATQAAHSAAGAWTLEGAQPAPSPAAADEDEYLPYADAWEGIA